MSTQPFPDSDTLAWLLEPGDPGVRYLALRDLCDLPAGDPELIQAREAAYCSGPLATVLAAMDPQGFWVEPGPGYNPKYTSSVWAIILLAQLGASIDQDERLRRACAYHLDHALAAGGQFTTSGAPSGTADCVQGNLCWAMVTLGVDDPRLELAYEWMARSVTGAGVAPLEDKHARLRYYAGKCGLLFACGSNNKLPCAWGAVKVMNALAAWPASRRSPLIEDATRQGADFLLDPNPSTANYPNGWSDKPSSNWWKFGFPVFYVTDILQIAEALVGLGYGKDARLANTLDLIREKRDATGRWALEYSYAGKTYGDWGAKKVANKWVTLRALRVLKSVA